MATAHTPGLARSSGATSAGGAESVAPCTLNGVIAEIDPDAVLRVGSRPYVYRDDLEALRQAHRDTHFFRRDRDTVASVAVVPGHEPIGEVRERRVRELGSYMPALVLDAVLRYFVGAQRPVLRHRPLTVLTARREDRLLRQALPDGVALPAWIEQRIQYVFDTRPVYPDGRPPAVLLVCEARTAITIDATGDTLLAAGVPLQGLYVQTMAGDTADPRRRPKARLAGRVVRIDVDQLILDDHGNGPGVVPAASVVLEPRRENVAHCLRHLVPEHADAIRGRLERLTAAVAGGPERLRRVRAMFDHLRAVLLEVVPNVPVRLSDLVRHGQEGVWSPLQGLVPRPNLVFDPAGQRTDSWSERGLNKFGPYDRGSMPVKRPRIAVVCEADARAEVERFVQRLVDGMPDVNVNGRQPYGKGLVARYALEAPTVEYFEAADGGAPAYRIACRAAIQHAADCGAEWHVALVQIDDASRQLAGASDPYLISKSAFMKRQVPVQEVTRQNVTLAPRDLAYILGNVSLALYAKLGGTPWLLPAKSAAAHEIVLGLGSYEAAGSRLGARERVVGVTTAFTADGRYLLESRTRAVPYEDYASAMLGALRDAVTTVGREHNWRRSDPVRLVVHAFKPIKDVEVDAVERLIKDLGLPNATFAFLHVAEDHPFLLFDEAQLGHSYRGTARGAFAPDRGTVVPLGRDEWLLSLTGPKELKQASDGMPSPTLLKLHRKSTFRNMKYLTRQAYAFACHSWRGFGLSAQPVTILYSDQIARVLKKLDGVPDWDADAMAGRIGRSRWFL